MCIRDRLQTVLNEIVHDQSTGFTGGRIWKLYPEIEGYRLLYQTGKMEKIENNFVIRALEYPVFEQLAQSRTILGHETIEALRKKGIFKYSASGVGHKTKIQGKPFYQFVLALNSKNIDEESVSYTHLRAHETVLDLVCRLLLEKKHIKKKKMPTTKSYNTRKYVD